MDNERATLFYDSFLFYPSLHLHLEVCQAIESKDNMEEYKPEADVSRQEMVPPDEKYDGQHLGRATQAQDHNRGYLETLRRDPRLLFWIGLMLWTLVVRGFENQSSGAIVSIPVFKQRFGEQEEGGEQYFIDTEWLSALNGGAQAFSIIGAWASSYASDRVGVKPTIIVAACINVASIGIEFATTSIGVFFAGKMVNFISIGAFQVLCTSYVSEVAPLAIRASAIGFCNLSQCIGPFISAIMSYYTSSWNDDWSWQSIICAQWGFAAVALIGHLFMPESPVFLTRKGKFTEAQKVLERLYTDPTDARGRLEVIKFTLEEAETSGYGTYWDAFKGTNLRRTLLAIMVFVSEPMSGLGFVSNYGALMYQYLGIEGQESFALQIGAQVLSITGATLSFLVADFVGRRPMYVTGCTALCILLICMGIAGSIDTQAAVTGAVAFYTMFNFFYNFGVGSVVYSLAGEIPTSALRGKSLAISVSSMNAVNTMWSFVAPYMFNPDYGNLKARIGFVFGAFMAIWAVMAFFYVPETRLRSYEELDELFMNKVPARKFKRYQTVAETKAGTAYAEEKKIGGVEETQKEERAMS